MSFESSVLKLGSPTKELVLAVSHKESALIGREDLDKQEIISWIDKSGTDAIVSKEKLKELDATLITKTYIATNYLTAADVALYGALHPIVAGLQPTEYYSVPAVTRYFDHIQTQPIVRQEADSLGDSFKLVLLDLENAPKSERKVEPSKKKEKASKATEASSSRVPTDAPAPQLDKGKRKEKKAATNAEGSKEDSKKGGKATASAEDDSEPLPSMIDLRVGHIIDISKHPDADSLYVEQIDIGEESGPRTVVSGLVNYIPIEQMRDKYLVAVCNLKPANMRGVKSFAMVLCATSGEGKEGGIELIQPPAGSKPGDRVYFEDFEAATPLSQLNPKKKIFETIQPGFTTLDSKEAAWINPANQKIHKIRTSKGTCIAPTFVGATLS
ncbi:hypothetical protein CPB83DRAFT_756528 [Crepidotus variabilis]|uniref:Nucleic acid-binding protein n=1 Tax=Crepidotus variabilis TaxID=179855 RepID=A0A9P6JWE2_9AGAR|nr:hypothetical protein CPB83DRAFT_756528 [Crepidotus variabilis]